MNKTSDIVVVGGGLIGSMIAHHFRANNYEVLVIDNNDPLSASKCSGGLWKASWVQSISEEAKHGESIIGKYFPIEEVSLKNDKNEIEKFNYVNCNEVLVKPDIIGSVTSVKNDTVSVICDNKIGHKITANKAVIIAAGYATNYILEKAGYKLKSNVDAVWGLVFEFNGTTPQNKISIWAPYRQSTLFNREGFYYFGDGCTVKNPKMVSNELSDKRIEFASDRLIEHAYDIGCDLDELRATKEGMRPYIQKNENIINQYDKKLFGAVGTAKNGTVLCGHIADNLLKIVNKLK